MIFYFFLFDDAFFFNNSTRNILDPISGRFTIVISKTDHRGETDLFQL